MPVGNRCCSVQRGPWGASSTQRLGPPSAASGIARLIKKLFRRNQICRFETLRKEVVDWLKAGDGIGGPP